MKSKTLVSSIQISSIFSNSLRLQKARKKYAKNITPEDCADMLEEDIEQIKAIYTLILAHPDWDDSQICSQIK